MKQGSGEAGLDRSRAWVVDADCIRDLHTSLLLHLAAERLGGTVRSGVFENVTHWDYSRS